MSHLHVPSFTRNIKEFDTKQFKDVSLEKVRMQFTIMSIVVDISTYIHTCMIIILKWISHKYKEECLTHDNQGHSPMS